MCVYTTKLKNRRYTKTKKNRGVVPPLPDRRIEYVPTKCGKCIECRKQYARDWTIRLLEHIKTNTNGKNTTLTLSNESIQELHTHKITMVDKQSGEKKTVPISNLTGYTKDNAIATRAVRLFNERWRKEFKKSPQHWLVTELGHNGTENIHLHGIIWTNEHYDTIRKIWKYGWIWPRPETQIKPYVNMETVGYITKYISKQDLLHKEYRAKILCSKNIGANYINTINAQANFFNNRETEEYYTSSTGHKLSMPKYYRNKLYTEWELEHLWLNNLDKEQAFVLGKKIDLKKGNKEYKQAIQDARRLNAEMGYGMRQNDNRKEHEEQRREKMIQRRIQTPSARSIQKG